MRRGIIGVADPDSFGAADGIDTVETEVWKNQISANTTLKMALDVKRQTTLSGGEDYYVGEAIRERATERDIFQINDDGTINSTVDTEHVVQDHTQFAVITATDEHYGFMIVSSSEGVFAFNLVTSQNVGRVVGTEINLGSFYKDRETDFQPETSGGNTATPTTDKITAWGHDVMESEDVGELLAAAAESNTLNQLAGQYVYDSGETSFPMNVNLAQSGYAEIWNPSDITTSEYLEWVESEILPYTTVTVNATDGSQSKLTE